MPGVRDQAEAGDVLFGNIDTFLVWHLTGGTNGGVHVTDVTNASRTQLMNLETLAWDEELLDAFGIPRPMLPQICSSSEVYGQSQVALAGRRPDRGHPGRSAGRAGGANLLQARRSQEHLWHRLLPADEHRRRSPVQSKHGLLTTVAYKFGKQPARYALEGSVAITGALVQWLRDNLGLIENSAEIEALARTVKDNGGVYFVPAFSGLYAPYWKDNARGVIAGLTRYANKGHLARAVLEATAFQTREVVEAMEKDSGIALDVLRVDGGMVENDLLMQFQADILDRPVVRPRERDHRAGRRLCGRPGSRLLQGPDDLRRSGRWTRPGTRRWKKRSGRRCTGCGKRP